MIPMDFTSRTHTNILTMPTVLEQTPEGTRAYDLFSRLLKERIVMLCDEVTDQSAQIIIGELLFLESEDPDKDIYMYINSPGGSVSAGLAIYDTMNYIKCDVATICCGMAASMGAVLLSSGAKGKRMALPNSRVMIHQPLGGMQGQAADMAIEMEEMRKCKDNLMRILSENSGKSIEEITKDCDRNHWLSAKEAADYGLVDRVITHNEAR